MLKCPNCYSKDLVKSGNYYQCQICGKRVPAEELELKDRQDSTRLNKFRSEIYDVYRELGQGITRKELEESLAKNSREIEEKLAADRRGYEQFIQSQKDIYDEFLAELNMHHAESNAKEVNDDIQLTAELFLKVYDFQGFASRLYNDIEHNLIYKYDLEYKKQEFIIPVDKYNALIQKTMTDKSAYSPLVCWKEKDHEYVPLIPKKEFLPGYYKMIPAVRFLCAGLDNLSAKKGQTMWNILNWIRHDNEENVKNLTKALAKLNVDVNDKEAVKKYLQSVLEFFRDKGLYTKD